MIELYLNESNQLIVAGDLTFATVGLALKKFKGFLPKQKKLMIDFSRVESCDSAGVALLLLWQKDAKAAGVSLFFNGINTKMLNIITVCELNEILHHGN